MKDEALILRQLRDPSTRETAFTRLMHEYQEPLYWMIRRMVRVHADADDILQNTFLKAWNGLDAFRHESKLQTWLYRIAINETLNHLARRKPMFSINQSEASPAGQLAADSYFDGDELQQRFVSAIDTLPDKQRLVFNLKYFDEMKYEDMSRLLDTSVGALKASYHHAVRKISSLIGNDD